MAFTTEKNRKGFGKIYKLLSLALFSFNLFRYFCFSCLKDQLDQSFQEKKFGAYLNQWTTIKANIHLPKYLHFEVSKKTGKIFFEAGCRKKNFTVGLFWQKNHFSEKKLIPSIFLTHLWPPCWTLITREWGEVTFD